MTKRTEPSAWARHQAFNILQRHPPCLRDDVPMNYFIDDIADRLDDARICGRADALGGRTEVRNDGEQARES
jgi:hypothetical protein